MRRTAPDRIFVGCYEIVEITEGPDKGSVIRAGKRMSVLVCAARSKGLRKSLDEECLGCTKWIDELRGIKK